MVPKWSRIFCVAIVTVILLASCTAAAYAPAAEASTSGASATRPSTRNYIRLLDANRINELPSTFALNQDRHEDPAQPFYGRTPLYSVQTNPQVVEQALRDHKSVGIVDPVLNQATLIRWEPPVRSSNPGRLGVGPF